jgi:hypothetical protein
MEAATLDESGHWRSPRHQRKMLPVSCEMGLFDAALSGFHPLFIMPSDFRTLPIQPLTGPCRVVVETECNPVHDFLSLAARIIIINMALL